MLAILHTLASPNANSLPPFLAYVQVPSCARLVLRVLALVIEGDSGAEG
jgi:hypothetical protein